MIFIYSKKFAKKTSRLSPKLKERLTERLNLFRKDPQNTLLKDHALTGDLLGKRSFSVTGNYRVIYKLVGREIIKLLNVDKHPQVYE